MEVSVIILTFRCYLIELSVHADNYCWYVTSVVGYSGVEYVDLLLDLGFQTTQKGRGHARMVPVVVEILLRLFYPSQRTDHLRARGLLSGESSSQGLRCRLQISGIKGEGYGLLC